MLNTMKGMLIEYALSLPPLVLVFEFNPERLTRTRHHHPAHGKRARHARRI